MNARDWTLAVVGTLACAGVGWSPARGQSPGSPRPGLTARQSADAVAIARRSLPEVSPSGTTAPGGKVEPRVYVVGVEFQALPAEPKPAPAAEPEPEADRKPAEGKAPRAVVTTYRYDDDATIYTVVDLATSRVVDVQTARHLRTPLSDAEYDEAQALAKEKSPEVRELHDRFGDRLRAYPQFSQFTVKGDPTIHRAVHLTYRIGTKDLSYPRPIVDLTERSVTVPKSEARPARRAKAPAATRGATE